MAQSSPVRKDDDTIPTEEESFAQIGKALEEDGLDALTNVHGDGLQEHLDDAIDFADIGDDDLADDEIPVSQQELDSLKTTSGKTVETAESSFTVNEDAEGSSFLDDLVNSGQVQDPYQNGGDDFDDLDNLFNDDDEGGDLQTDAMDAQPEPRPVADIPRQSILEHSADPMAEDEENEEEEDDMDDEVSAEWLEQQKLFNMSLQRLRGDEEGPATVETSEELVQQMFPTFKKGRTLKFTELLPHGRARYVGKTPLKVPKSVLPSKISLDIAKDHEKDFKLLAGGHKRTWDDSANDRLVVIRVDEGQASDEGNVSDDDSDYENEKVGGYSWQDFQIVCADWDLIGEDESRGDPLIEMVPEMDTDANMDLDDDLDDWEMGRAPKRQKLQPMGDNILNSIPRFEFPSFHDPAKATSRIANRVVLDLNDPMLLVNEVEPEVREVQKVVPDQGDKKMQRLAARYNISNDQEYEQLTAQHQSKSRSTLGSLTVNHSMPALRLQWPYYKTKLEKQECRSFHRPHSGFPKMEVITFKAPKIVKKKRVRGQETTAIFANTQDLSLADNSHVLLLEYSEQHPTMMSNFGMNSRLINYYRRKDLQDGNRPKLEIGELSVLQPQDTSPLTQFGNIDPGETTPAVYNGMFKAPIFEHTAKGTDFVLVRNSTGVNGSNWYLRNIEYMRVVGQQFPSTEVPGPNARKVTTAAKNRLKMVSYRLLKKSKTHTITVSKVTPHVLDPSGGPSNDMQNRQKLKEFLQFNKEHKEWELKPGDILPASDKIRDLVKPEDVCLLEAMQVGSQQLEDAGFGSNGGAPEDGQSDEEADNEDENIEQSLVPWQTTKNFIQAANNKAMLQLHGEGDPSKRGEAFSMLKISMKGGFRAEGESITDKMDAAKLKELGGHSYNVAKQAESYNRSVRAIWDKQKESLSSQIEPDLDQEDEEEEEEEDPVLESMVDGPDMQQLTKQVQSIPRRGRDDESVSQFSHVSRGSQHSHGQILKIVRRVRTRTGQEEERVEIVRDPRVIRQYLKLRKYKEAESVDLSDLQNLDPNDPEIKKRIAAEIARLERNKDRRIGREKQKMGGTTDSPGSPGPADEPKSKKGGTGGTGRKCANCGQIGHIKTNKKYVKAATASHSAASKSAAPNSAASNFADGYRLCPMLNGQMKQDDNFGEQSFTLSTAQL